LRMWGRAEAYGAVSVVNAVATGLGCSLGVCLRLEAEVKIIDGTEGVDVRLEGVEHQPSDVESSKIMAQAIIEALAKRRVGAEVTTYSEIPLARGLKSSSAAANAIALAAKAALGTEVDDLELVKIGVNAAIKAKVTITGAFDDACASYFGGYCLTDNTNLKLLKREQGPEDLEVVIYVPEERLEKQKISRQNVERFKPFALQAFKLASEGKYLEALTINGLVYSAALGFDVRAAAEAIKHGALAAGLSGTGPAVSALCRSEFVNELVSALQNLGGKVILTKVNNRRARVLSSG
jgi:shikimate kinase